MKNMIKVAFVAAFIIACMHHNKKLNCQNSLIDECLQCIREY